jgi:flagellar protein FliS
MTAGPEELRQLLLEGAIRFLRQGIDGLNAKNYEQSFSGISQSRAIVMELMTSVRADQAPELAERVQSLYSFMYTELVEASFSKDVARLSKVLDLLEFERETWAMAMDRLRRERAQEGRADPARAMSPGGESGQPAMVAGAAKQSGSMRPAFSAQG